jgi:SAM-dependent methyltransferase
VKRDAWNRRYGEPELAVEARPNRTLVAEVGGLAPGRAPDLACGAGRNAVWLAEQGWRVTGVDWAEAGLARARELAAARGVEVEWIAADLLEYEPPAQAFELVIAFYLQVPAADRRVVLARAARAVAPGGTFLLVAHDLRNLAEGVGGPSKASVLTTPEAVVADLPELEVERAERILRDVEGEDRPAVDTLVRATRPAAQAA